ncbi:MAG: nitrilase-related carbon-nitrogen hydrolase [Candidatus Thorarchaeota archaeon]|jgi:predicted amidohydrolase
MIRLGVAQMKPKVGEIEENIHSLNNVLKLASSKRVDVLVLPELTNSGYVFNSLDEAKRLAERIPEGKFSQLMIKWSKAGRLIVAGICEKTSDGLYNSAGVYADGKHITTYRKIHLFDKESDWFNAGTVEPPVIEYQDQLYGIMICFDWAFPETTRILALNGAQVILHPANLVLPYCQNAMITRSIENRVFTATANRIGKERGIVFSGESQVTNPKGKVLLKLGSEDIDVACVEIEPSDADNKMITQRNHVLNDRKPDLYTRLTEVT